jgi:hypothetical protein
LLAGAHGFVNRNAHLVAAGRCEEDISDMFTVLEGDLLDLPGCGLPAPPGGGRSSS